MIQDRFSEFGSSIVARNKFSSFTQKKTMAMHEYISEFTTIMEHAHDNRPSDSKSTILASTFIDGIQNPYINKLRSYNVQNLSELYGLAIKEDQKQKIRQLDFGNTTPKKQ